MTVPPAAAMKSVIEDSRVRRVYLASLIAWFRWVMPLATL
jgi:hypothetical protein